MITAITGIAPEWFAPTSEKDEEEKTEFKLKPLDQLTFLEVVATSEINESGMLVPSQQARRLVLKKGLIDWKNFCDSNGKTLKFSPHTFGTIPFSILSEICNKIMEISSPGENERKN